MAVLVGNHTKLLVQGITGQEGLFHAKGCKDYGTTVVGGVTPGKGGTEIDGFKVWNTVKDCVAATGANASMIFVPPWARRTRSSKRWKRASSSSSASPKASPSSTW